MATTFTVVTLVPTTKSVKFSRLGQLCKHLLRDRPSVCHVVGLGAAHAGALGHQWRLSGGPGGSCGGCRTTPCRIRRLCTMRCARTRVRLRATPTVPVLALDV